MELLRIIFENKGKVSNNELLKRIRVSATTLNKYLLELCMELPEGALIFFKDEIIIDTKRCSLYDMQIFYFSRSVVKELLHKCFFSKKMTLEKMAQELFISTSKLFKVINFVNTALKKLNVEIVKKKYIGIQGESGSILIIYNLLLHTEENPFYLSYNRLNEEKIQKDIMYFFQKNNIKIDSHVIRELSLWVITINDRFYLEKFYSSSKKTIIVNKDFISKESRLVKEVQCLFSVHNEKTFDYEGCVLFILFLLYNNISIHFESVIDEELFFNEYLVINYSYYDFLFAILIKKHYQINAKNITFVTLKIEGSIQFRNILCPYFQIYADFFNPKMKKSSYFKFVEESLEKDLSSFFDTYFSSINKKDICVFLAHILSFFQKKYFYEGNYTIGVYSAKGSSFERQLCEELKEYIQILPYDKFANEKINLLLVDDLRLLNSDIQYDDYFLLGDYLTEM